MKNSGIEWIGEIPENWEVNYFSCLFSEHKERNEGMKETNLLSLSYGKIVRKNIDDNEGLLPMSFETYNVVYKDNIIFRLTDLQNDKRSLRTAICKEKGIITSAYIAVKLKESESSNYMQYLFYSYDICKVFYGLGAGIRQGMNYKDLKKMPVLIPPIDEQQKIADYLDKRCENIDGLVELQNRMIEKLKEYKQSVITEAVTKGLNPAAKMKNSGVEWIGEIPENWEVKRLKNCGEFCSNGVDKKIYPDLPTYKAIHYINVYKNKLGILNDDSNYLIISCTNEKADLTRLQKGDIIITNSSETPDDIGVAAYVNDIDKNTLLGYHLMRFRPISNIISKFMLYCLNSKYVNAYFASVSNGITRYSLLGDDIKSLCFPCPPIDEQKKIADYLDAKCAEIDRLIEIKQKKIEKLQDYKKSLIYECVTGKREVS